MHTRYRILAGTIAGILIGATTSISLNVFAFKQTVQAAPPLDELQQFQTHWRLPLTPDKAGETSMLTPRTLLMIWFEISARNSCGR